jgi:flavin reductase (DIM6/NTAB) family NADH-FMN oxidoreductase RutF
MQPWNGMTPEPSGKTDLMMATERMPTGRFLMTAAHGDQRNGMLVTRVQKCADEPITITVAVRKGHALSPLIRDSAVFGLCELRGRDLMLSRLFNRPGDLRGEDPFLGHGLVPDTGRIPIPTASASWVRCDLIRHLDIEADHEIYIGRVMAGGVIETAAEACDADSIPAARKRRNGVATKKMKKPTRARPGVDNRVTKPTPKTSDVEAPESHGSS